MYRLRLLPGTGKRKTGTYHSISHIKAAGRTARESVVLLKNEGKLLPLELSDRVALIGQNATSIHSNGGGSAEIKALYEVTPLMALLNMGGGDTRIEYEPGYFIPEAFAAQSESWQETSLGDRRDDSGTYENVEAEAKKAALERMISEYRERAVRLAKENKQTIIFAGLNHDYDVEGRDKKTLKLPYHQDELIEEVLEVNPDAVVVIMGGAPVEMDWLSKAKAVVWYYYAGMEGATAVAEVLTGRVNPSGKLPETFPKHTEDIYPVKLGEFGRSDRLEYRDGVFVGYRYYVSRNIETNFCFGHGLSYTDFSLHGATARCEGDRVIVSVMLKNVGERRGKETVQLYITPPIGSVERPLMELRAFKKKALDPKEEKRLEFVLDKRAFCYYDEQLRDFNLETGEYKISLGMSVLDIRQSVSVLYSGEKGFEA